MMTRRLVVLALGIVPAVSVSAAQRIVAQQPSMTEIIAVSWLGPSLPLPAGATADDRAIVAIARRADMGEIHGASASLDSLEQHSSASRTLFLATLIAEHLDWRRFRYSSGGHLADGLSLFDFLRRTAGAGSVAQRVAMRQQQLPGQLLADGQLAAALSQNLEQCRGDNPAFLRWVRAGAEAPEFRGNIAPAMAMRGQCMAFLFGVLNSAKNAAALTSTEVALIDADVSAALAIGAGDSTAGQQALARGESIARGAGLERSAAEFALRLVDLDAAPNGDPLAFGYNLTSEATILQLLSVSGFVPRAVRVPASAAHAGFLRRYADVERRLAATGDRTAHARILVRRAVVERQAGLIDSAAFLYSQAAAAGQTVASWPERIAGLVGVGLLTRQPRPIADAIRTALAMGDSGSAIGVAETASAWAVRLIWVGRDFAHGMQTLQAAIDALDQTGFRRASVPLLETLGRVYSLTQRPEAAIAANREAVILERSIFEELRTGQAAALANNAAALPVIGGEAQRLTNLTANFLYAVSLRSTVEDSALWSAQRDSAERELTSLSATYPPADTALQRYRSLRRGLVANFETIRAEFAAHGDCADFRARATRLTQAALDTIQRLQSEVLLGACDSTRLAHVRTVLRTRDPVARLAAAFESARGDSTSATRLALTQARLDLPLYMNLALTSGALDVAEQWTDALARLQARDPGIAGDALIVPFYRGFIWANQGKLSQARDTLASLARNEAWLRSLSPSSRSALLGTLGDIESRLGNAESALLAFERKKADEELWLAERSGLRPTSRASAEIAMLERAIALGGATEMQLARLHALRAADAEEVALSSAFDSSAVRRVLHSMPKDVVALAYALSRGVLIAWRIDASGVSMFRLATPPGVVRSITADFVDRVSNGIVDSTAADASALYAAVVAPLGKLPPGTTVVAVNSGVLGDLPLDLIGSFPDSTLGHSHPIVYVERVGALLERQPLEGKSDRSVQTSAAAVVVGLNDNGLSFAEDEARAVGKAIHATPIIGSSASVESVARALAPADYVHFATHAYIDHSNPFVSYLALHNGNYEAWQLFRDAPAARLVVLSACSTRNTARDPDVGDPVSGASSLAEVAMSAGARWVVGTLWPVNDARTPELMRLFYQRLTAGSDVPAALQAAKQGVSTTPIDAMAPAAFVVTARDLATVIEAATTTRR